MRVPHPSFGFVSRAERHYHMLGKYKLITGRREGYSGEVVDHLAEELVGDFCKDIDEYGAGDQLVRR